jgi:RNA polymerase sigma-70 factor (ECF subfamily)
VNPSIREQTDAALFTLLTSASSLQAFAELYERHNRRILHYCERLLGSVDDGADAFQETWIQFHQAGVSGSVVVDNVRGYLFTVARNACLMKLRSKRVQLIRLEDLAMEPHCPTTSSPDNEVRDLLSKALEVLDHGSREAYILHDIEGFSYEEISAITNTSVHALRNKVWRARTHVRTYLAPHVGVNHG